MARHHLGDEPGDERANEPADASGDEPGGMPGLDPGAVPGEDSAPAGEGPDAWQGPVVFEGPEVSTNPDGTDGTDGSDGSDSSDGSDANPLSAAGLWDNERPPRRVRPPVEDAGGAAGGPDTVGAAAAGVAGQRRMTHGPDGRRAGATPPKRPRDPVRTTVRGVGQLLITAGVIVLLFVVYELWITNIFGGHRQAEATAALDKLWATEQVTVTQGGVAVVTGSAGEDAPVVSGGPTLTNQTGARSRHYDTEEGSGFAKLYIPSFGADFVFTVIEGTDENDLYSGPGHYLGTQYPGEPGNFAMAGHRVNKGAPFNDLDLLNPCDAIVIETVDAWYVYRMLPTEQESAGWSSAAHQHCDGVEAQTGQYAGVYGREITSPSDYQQVLPVPHLNSTNVPADAEKLITLTTCNPKFSDAQRMIVHGVMVKSYPKNGSFLPPELGETT